MRVTLKFWQFVKFTAEKRNLKPHTVYYQLMRESKIKIKGSHGNKTVAVDLMASDVNKLNQEKALRRVKYCECGRVATRKMSSQYICERCWKIQTTLDSELYARRRKISIPEEYRMNCAI